MNRLPILMLLFLFPALVCADTGGLSFAPPPGDYSVIFLANIFGIVDGVLHGTGSQMLGAMFAVFNSAVLSLGGIIIMYTLMVSTMNTAHEGQMLGQKWSSIWIPVRSTLGLALLIPKASGYCLMQIFVMWLVVQGVGAADKIWDAALSYLNRGGVIIQAQATNPADVLIASGGSGVSIGAMTLLSGQVCMLGLQKQLEAQRQSYLNEPNPGHCQKDASIKVLCDNAIPDFLGSVNAVTFQSQHPTNSSFAMPMPNFQGDSNPYSFLNGICGQLTWSPIQGLTNAAPPTGSNASVNSVSLSSTEYQTAQMSRAIAIQQMYLDLSSIAQVMINNDPQIAGSPPATGSTPPYNAVATQQFGVPYTTNGVVCGAYSDTCTTWGLAAASTAGGMLFNGTEFLGAINDYNGIMMPTLNLMKESNDAKSKDNSRAFINQASSQGWMMAGAYFFDLVKLNGHAAKNANLTDTDTGMDGSKFSAADVGDVCDPSSNFKSLCAWFGNDASKLLSVQSLIDGSGFVSPSTDKPNLSSSMLNFKLKSDNKIDSTVYGFINNSMMVQLPGQPGLNSLQFSKKMSFTIDTTPLKLKPQKFSCGKVVILAFKFCLGWLFGNLFYNIIFLFVYNSLMTVFQQTIESVVMAFLMIPLQGMSTIFQEGVKAISKPGVNPIVALANMGVQYINFSGNLWIMLLVMSINTIILPWYGLFIMALMAMAMPLLLAWVGIMTSIGFVTAYYIPLLPYMMFLFGTLAWLMCVIEAMVAAPIVALGITHPEGHDAFGKGEQAIMILLNVFLRPAMMIIGYISAISLSYVGVWILNAGFDHAVSYMQGGDLSTKALSKNSASSLWSDLNKGPDAVGNTMKQNYKDTDLGWGNPFTQKQEQGSGSGETKYTEWAGIYAFFFSILSYTTMYMIIVQKSFSMISVLPDKVLRWIGGNPENLGQESSQWGDEVKQAGKEGASKSYDAQIQMGKQAGGKAEKGILAGAKGLSKATGGGNIGGKGTTPSSTPSK